MNTLNLNGDWTLTGFDENGVSQYTVPGRVPGHVHPDLQRAGKIADPFWRDQGDLCQWVEHWTWSYQRTFTVAPDFNRDWTVLTFDGLDTFTTILLNGEMIGRTQNMFIPHEFEVGALLKEGENIIEVRFAPALASVSHKPHKNFPAVFCPGGERVYARRMQCGYGWDWVHRFVSAGIWQPCRLRSYDGVRLQDLYAATTSLSPDEAVLHIEAAATLRGNNAKSIQFEIEAPSGKIIWSESFDAAEKTFSMTAQIPSPQLWWPVGCGGQPLYIVRATAVNAQGAILDQTVIETGLRTVAIEEIPDADGSSFTIIINGERVFMKGGNWVPADPFPSQVTPNRYARLIEQASSAGLNLLRSWGGGIYEPEEFWKQCNRQGVMVSQDFLLACACYPEDDPEWVDQLKAEYPIAIKRLRNHPALAFWCGDNELGLGNRPDDAWSGKRIAQEITGPLCAELDPSRPFRLTSPYGGDPNNSTLIGDNHTNCMFTDEMRYGAMDGYRKVASDVTARFMSEHGVSGAPPKRSALKFMTESDLSDPAMWEYHTKDNPNGRGQTLYQAIERESKLLYGDPGKDTDRAIRQMGYIQYEFIRLAMESCRRRKYWCSGIQFWMYNDCWPAAGWSVLDYWGFRKAGWYGMNAGYRPVIAAQEVTDDAINWHICNDLRRPIDVAISLRIQPWTGAPRWSETLAVHSDADTSALAVTLPLEEMHALLGKDAVLVCDIAYAGGADHAWYYAGMPFEMQPPSANLTVNQTRDDSEGTGTVTIIAENYARVVTLDADVDFSDNYFEMMPGESRTITWRSPIRPFAEPIGVSSWNM